MTESHRRREAEAIRQQMLHVRGRMPYAMDIARSEAKQLLDWKYYVGRFPLSAAAIAAGVAYWIIPSRSKQPQRQVGGQRDSDGETSEVATKASLVGGAMSLLTSLAVRGATSYFSGRLQDYLSEQAAAKKKNPHRERSVT